MIDGVVLVALNQPEEMRDFDADATFVSYEGSQSLTEVDDVRHVGEHIVGNDEVSLSVSDGHIHAGLLAEEHDLGLNAPAASDLERWRLARYKRANTTSDAVLQKVSVVAGHFDHKRAGSEIQGLDGVLDEPPCVGHPGVGVGREVGIVGEDVFRRYVRGKLNQ